MTFMEFCFRYLYMIHKDSVPNTQSKYTNRVIIFYHLSLIFINERKMNEYLFENAIEGNHPIIEIDESSALGVQLVSNANIREGGRKRFFAV